VGYSTRRLWEQVSSSGELAQGVAVHPTDVRVGEFQVLFSNGWPAR